MKDAAARPRVEEVQAREHHVHVPVNVNVNVSARREGVWECAWECECEGAAHVRARERLVEGAELIEQRGDRAAGAVPVSVSVTCECECECEGAKLVEPPAQYLSATQVGR